MSAATRPEQRPPLFCSSQPLSISRALISWLREPSLPLWRPAAVPICPNRSLHRLDGFKPPGLALQLWPHTSLGLWAGYSVWERWGKGRWYERKGTKAWNYSPDVIHWPICIIAHYHLGSVYISREPRGLSWFIPYTCTCAHTHTHTHSPMRRATGDVTAQNPKPHPRTKWLLEFDWLQCPTKRWRSSAYSTAFKSKLCGTAGLTEQTRLNALCFLVISLVWPGKQAFWFSPLNYSSIVDLSPECILPAITGVCVCIPSCVMHPAALQYILNTGQYKIYQGWLNAFNFCKCGIFIEIQSSMLKVTAPGVNLQPVW